MSITAEAPDIRSVVCLNDSYQALPISAGYDQFVRRPTGIIEKLLGPSAYRVDVSAPITQGDSWQLGLALAHILKHNDEFVDHGGGTLIWASGEVDSQLRVNSVDHIAATKIEASREMLQSAIRERTEGDTAYCHRKTSAIYPSGHHLRRDCFRRFQPCRKL